MMQMFHALPYPTLWTQVSMPCAIRKLVYQIAVETTPCFAGEISIRRLIYCAGSLYIYLCIVCCCPLEEIRRGCSLLARIIFLYGS